MAVDSAYPKEPFTLSKLWTDKYYRGITVQILTLGIVALVAWEMIGNVRENFKELGKDFSFDFLWSLPASYDINQCVFAYDKSQPHMYAALCGVGNTLIVAIVGCITATILGFTVGVLRLSNNWIVSKIAYVYMEFMRNVPILLHILFWWGLIVNILPNMRDEIIPELKAIAKEEGVKLGELYSVRPDLDPGALILSNRGFTTYAPIFGDGFGMVMLAIPIAIALIYFMVRWARKRQEATGAQFPTFFAGVGILFGLPLLTFFAMGSPLTFEEPVLGNFGYRPGTGLTVTPELFALTFALTIYTSAFIGEIVRSGIQAINKGQWEAAGALGIKRSQTLTKIIIPQALRVIVPPLTSQYLNLTKNSSLAIAIGYMDIVSTLGGITLMQTGKEMETVLLLMAFYLTISLSISLFMNWYNSAIALKER